MSAQSPILQIAAQYTTDASFQSLMRPYENSAPVQAALATEARHEQLPQPGHWRVELAVSLQGLAGETVLYKARVAQEFIVVVQNVTPDELQHILTLQVPARMFAYARTELSTLSLNTGYGPLVLPAVSDAYLQGAQKKTELADQASELEGEAS